MSGSVFPPDSPPIEKSIPSAEAYAALVGNLKDLSVSGLEEGCSNAQIPPPFAVGGELPDSVLPDLDVHVATVVSSDSAEDVEAATSGICPQRLIIQGQWSMSWYSPDVNA